MAFLNDIPVLLEGCFETRSTEPLSNVVDEGIYQAATLTPVSPYQDIQRPIPPASERDFTPRGNPGREECN
jgi:hypothetical protein